MLVLYLCTGKCWAGCAETCRKKIPRRPRQVGGGMARKRKLKVAAVAGAAPPAALVPILTSPAVAHNTCYSSRWQTPSAVRNAGWTWTGHGKIPRPIADLSRATHARQGDLAAAEARLGVERRIKAYFSTKEVVSIERVKSDCTQEVGSVDVARTKEEETGPPRAMLSNPCPKSIRTDLVPQVEHRCRIAIFMQCHDSSLKIRRATQWHVTAASSGDRQKPLTRLK